jgi:UDP-N-acetylmuramoyl-tripeptide--D-alanyl-D-alanine ligase
MKKKFWIVIIVVIVLLAGGYYFLFRYQSGELNRQILDKSLVLGKSFLLNNQQPAGNFNYEYNFLTKETGKGDSQVRQAGALWGLSLIHNDDPGRESYNALVKGFKFFLNNSFLMMDSLRFVKYPDTHNGRTGTLALLCLAYIEFLSADFRGEYDSIFYDHFNEYFRFLLSLRKDDGSFYSTYRYTSGEGYGEPSPYFDGESLLAMVKAARYLDFQYLKPLILESAESMYQRHVTIAREVEDDSPVTKGFYQWGSMSFLGIYKAGWGDQYAQWLIDLAYWMIDIHKTIWRTKKTAYAHEGMISVWKAANVTGNKKTKKKIGRVVNKGLYKLTTWQVGGPVENRYLRKHPTDDPVAVGGIMNCRKCPVLRIDVTQHQMHAVILARKYIYTATQAGKTE